MNKICFGCGSTLQSNDKEKEGYIPKEKYETSSYCQRCFRITHYGDVKEVNTPKNINEIVNNINKNAKYVLFLTDFITLNSEIIKVYRKIKTSKTLVIGKCDLIPKSIHFSNIINCLKDTYKIKEDIKLISSKTNYGIKSLLDGLTLMNINECYIVGESNSGKSTLINKLIDLTDSKLDKITTSKRLNTTLNFIRLKLNDDLTIIDSPGFVLSDNNTIENVIKPKTFQMKKDEIINIDNMYLKFDKNTSITIYMNNDLKTKKHFKDTLFDYNINVKSDTDLIIKRLGFINIKNECKVEIKNVKIEELEIRKSIFGGNHE